MNTLPVELFSHVCAQISPKDRASACSISSLFERLCLGLLPPLSSDVTKRFILVNSNYHLAVRLSEKSALNQFYADSIDSFDLCIAHGKKNLLGALVAAAAAGNRELIYKIYHMETGEISPSMYAAAYYIALRGGNELASALIYDIMRKPAGRLTQIGQFGELLPLEAIVPVLPERLFHAYYGGNRILMKGLDESTARLAFEGACSAGRVELMKELLELYAVDCQAGITLAASSGHITAVTLLLCLETGLSTRAQLTKYTWQGAITAGAVDIASMHSVRADWFELRLSTTSAKMTEYLLSVGFKNTWALMHDACQEGNFEVVEYLIGMGMELDDIFTDLAYSSGHVDIARILPKSSNCLKAACRGGYYPAIRMALEHSTDYLGGLRGAADVGNDDVEEWMNRLIGAAA